MQSGDTYSLVPGGPGSKVSPHSSASMTSADDYERGVPLAGEFEELSWKIAEAEQARGAVTEREQATKAELARVDALWQKKREPFLSGLKEIEKEKDKYSLEIHLCQERLHALAEAVLSYDLGPKSFRFVEHALFDAWCNLVVTSNLIQMGLQMSGQYDSYQSVYAILDQLFLTWYFIEVSCKIIYYRKNFFVGNVFVVWWNYLDSLIVVSGVLDQWMSFLFAGVIDTSMVKLLRFLRIFRLLRILKLLRAFFKSDLSWTEEENFVFAMTCVIGLNSIVMALELDHAWAYWIVVENIFLILYTFELVCKLKHHGFEFFYSPKDMIWNLLDFTIVAGAILDQWFFPLLSLIATGMGYKHGLNFKSLGVVIRFLRLMRLLRVLRLVRLLKRIKPLYSLLMGVIEALEAMKWVMVLTGMLLYMSAIVFTTLVGGGMIFDSESDEFRQLVTDADVFYGTVSESIFSLFKMMNGDTEPLEPMRMTAVGKILFVIFMVVANWAILAILTSVVSDNMISASTRDKEKEEEEETYKKDVERKELIQELFKRIDHNHNGIISEDEWTQMLSDRDTRYELMEASGLEEQFLQDLFMSLCHDEEDENGEKTKCLSYAHFVEHMKDESKVANQRSMMAMMAHFKALDSKIDSLVNHFEVQTLRSRKTSIASSRVANGNKSPTFNPSSVQ